MKATDTMPTERSVADTAPIGSPTSRDARTGVPTDSTMNRTPLSRSNSTVKNRGPDEVPTDGASSPAMSSELTDSRTERVSISPSSPRTMTHCAEGRASATAVAIARAVTGVSDSARASRAASRASSSS